MALRNRELHARNDDDDVHMYFVTFFTLPFNELSLVGLAVDLVDLPLSFSAVTLLVGSSDL